MDELGLILHNQKQLEHKLDAVLLTLGWIVRMEERMSQEVDDLTKAVENEITVEASAVALIQGLAAQIVAAKNDPAAIEALAGQITSSSTALAAAITANTPAAPAAPPVAPTA